MLSIPARYPKWRFNKRLGGYRPTRRGLNFEGVDQAWELLVALIAVDLRKGHTCCLGEGVRANVVLFHPLKQRRDVFLTLHTRYGTQ